MSKRLIFVMDTKTNLRVEYRKTWETFSRHMKRVHELAGSAEPGALESATREADLALFAHKEARDRLAELLAGDSTPASAWRSGFQLLHSQMQDHATTGDKVELAAS